MQQNMDVHKTNNTTTSMQLHTYISIHYIFSFLQVFNLVYQEAFESFLSAGWRHRNMSLRARTISTNSLPRLLCILLCNVHVAKSTNVSRTKFISGQFFQLFNSNMYALVLKNCLYQETQEGLQGVLM